MKRCHWCNENNPLYIHYHDEEWGRLCLKDAYLFEMLVLESFQAGLSWECVLNKREAFRSALDQFNPQVISNYDEAKLEELLNNKAIIRHKQKLKAAVKNAQVFLRLQKEYGSFANYLLTFTKGRVYYEQHQVTSALSDAVAKDLRRQGMSFVGSTTVYAYLQAVGIIQSHEPECFLYKNK